MAASRRLLAYRRKISGKRAREAARDQGLAAREAADMLGISEPTVRTHVQRMLAKTGTSRQAELLQLLERSAPPVDAG